MAKWFGKIGYVDLIETTPGVWQESITEEEYQGELIRNTRRYDSSGQVNDNLSISNTIKIAADPYHIKNFYSIRYAEFLGIKWKVSSIEVQYPKLLLTLGGVYNGEDSPGSISAS